MSSYNVVLCILALVACPAVQANKATHLSERSFLRTEIKRDGPKDVVKKIKDAVMPGDKKEDKKQEEKKAEGRPMEDPISIMRGLCTRVIAHVKEHCLKKDQEACEWAKLLGIDIEHPDDKDDASAEDPKDHKQPPEASAPAPAAALEKPTEAPAPGSASAPAAAKEKAAAAPAPAKAAAEKEEPAKDTEYEDPYDAKGGLQSQGFSGNKVSHADGKSMTSDWGDEYGNHKDPKKSGSVRSWNTPALVGAALIVLGCA